MMPRVRHWSLVGCLFAGLYAGGSGRAAERLELRSALESITSSELQQHVDVLADDTLEGREAGSRGGRAAAGYLVQKLQEYGAVGAGEDASYFQGFHQGYRNVLGLIEGADEKLREEVVIISAHYDHVGYGTARNSYGPTGYIHNGADDNASGTAGILEIAEAVRRLPQPPRRSLLLAFWDGEEQGLLGSTHWLQQPTLPLDRVVAMINVDMIGRMREDRVEIFGSRTGFGWRELLSRKNDESQLTLDFNWEMKANSDHYPFYSHGIPALMLHTGLHEDYHRPSDDAHKVNAEGMQRVARLLFQVAFELADRPSRQGFRNDARREGPGSQQALELPLPLPAPRLGISWQPLPGEGLRISQVHRGSAAQRAGLQTGDVIVELDGERPVEEEFFRRRIVTASRTVNLVVRRESEGEPLPLSVELDGQPARVGIAWREDSAEPGSVLVTQVLPGSAADFAGIRTRDRLLEIAGRPFTSSDDLFQRLVQEPSPIAVLLERQGRLHRLSLEVQPVQ